MSGLIVGNRHDLVIRLILYGEVNSVLRYIKIINSIKSFKHHNINDDREYLLSTVYEHYKLCNIIFYLARRVVGQVK